MAYVLLWFLFGIFSGILASSKNRSVFGWILIGALFGPFGLLVAFMPKVQDKTCDPREETEHQQEYRSEIGMVTQEIRAKPLRKTWNRVKRSILNQLGDVASIDIVQNDDHALVVQGAGMAVNASHELRKDGAYVLVKTHGIDLDFDEFGAVTETGRSIELGGMAGDGLITQKAFETQKA